jgi:hypothetical protein
MICRFVDENCPDDCAHKRPHDEITDDDFGEHKPCALAHDCEHCGSAAYCVPLDENDDFGGLMEPDIDTPFDGWP